MECTLTEPVVLDTNGDLVAPTDDSLPFQFQKIDCDLEFPEESSPSSTLVTIDPDSTYYIGITETITSFHVVTILVLLVLGVLTAYTFFKR